LFDCVRGIGFFHDDSQVGLCKNKDTFYLQNLVERRFADSGVELEAIFQSWLADYENNLPFWSIDPTRAQHLQ
jgi:hypothetical protein